MKLIKLWRIIFIFILGGLSSCLYSADEAGLDSEKILFLSDRPLFIPNIFLLDIKTQLVSSITEDDNGYYDPDWSPNGDKIIFSSNLDPEGYRTARVLHIMNLDQSGKNIVSETLDLAFEPKISPDGKHIAFVSSRENFFDLEIFIIDIDGTNLRNLTNDGSNDRAPAWSPDGNEIAFVSDRDGNLEIYVMSSDGGNQRNITRHPNQDYEPSWSPDGKKILFTTNRDDSSAGQPTPTIDLLTIPTNKFNLEVYVMNSDGSNQVNLSNNPASDFQADWSPDGSKIAFVSNRDGNKEIYIMNPDGSNQENLTNHPSNDFSPAWKP